MNHRPALLLSLLAFAIPLTARAQSYPPVWNNTTDYVAGDLVTDYGNIYRCIRAVNTPYLDPSKTYADWELYDVRSNTTLTIGAGQTFPTLTAAWAYALNTRIAGGVYLHFSISTAHGNFSDAIGVPMSLDHPFGANMSIIGDNMDDITLTFNQEYKSGLMIDTGHCFGALSNLQIDSVSASPGSAIYATSNATIGAISNINMNPWYSFVDAEEGANLNFTGDFQWNGATFRFCTATTGATINFTNGVLTLNGKRGGPNTPFGLYASFGGTLSAEYRLHCRLPNWRGRRQQRAS